MIASWRTDLSRILLVFNVCSVVSVRSVLTVCSQTELGLNIYVAVSDVRDGVTATHAAVADTHVVVADTHAMVSEIHRKMTGSQDGADDQSWLVSDIRTVPTTKYMLTTAQDQTRSATSTTNGSSVLYFYLVSLVNYLHRRQGSVSDVTN